MQASANADLELPEPTRARHITLGFLCSMALILYLDRICIAQALEPMKAAFGWSNTQTSLVLMSFTLAYGLFEIPTGRLGDLCGSRGVLTRIVLWWSVFTALTGTVSDFTYIGALGEIPIVFNTLLLMVLIRFWFGAGEAGAIPNGARVLKHWFSEAERGTMQGRFQASMHIGGAVAPIIAATIIDSPLGWRGAFVVFGFVGVIWATAFYWWFRDEPAEHPAVNQAELQYIGIRTGADARGHGAVPWGAALAHPNVWLLGITITMSAFNSYFFFSWYPSYLQQARDVDNCTAGWLAALALVGATLGSLTGGVIADRITRLAVDRYRARRRLALCSYLGAAACLFASVNVDIPPLSAELGGFASVYVDSTLLSAVLCGCACYSLFCLLPTWWACSFEVSGKHTGALFGLMNGVGVVGAMGSQFFFGAFTDWRQAQGFVGRDRWDPAFYVSIVLLLVASALWQLIRQRPAVGESEATLMRSKNGPESEAVPPIKLPRPDDAIREGPPA